MAGTLLEKEAPQAPKRTSAMMPAIRREEKEPYTPLDALGRGAVHIRIPAELTLLGNAKAISRADFDMRVARNVSELRLEGSTPLPERFLGLLDALI